MIRCREAHAHRRTRQFDVTAPVTESRCTRNAVMVLAMGDVRSNRCAGNRRAQHGWSFIAEAAADDRATRVPPCRHCERFVTASLSAASRGIGSSRACAKRRPARWLRGAGAGRCDYCSAREAPPGLGCVGGAGLRRLEQSEVDREPSVLFLTPVAKGSSPGTKRSGAGGSSSRTRRRGRVHHPRPGRSRGRAARSAHRSTDGVGRFLRIGVGLAHALCELHPRGLIHEDRETGERARRSGVRPRPADGPRNRVTPPPRAPDAGPARGDRRRACLRGSRAEGTDEPVGRLRGAISTRCRTTVRA